MQEIHQPQTALIGDSFELFNPTVEDFCFLNTCEDSLFNSLANYELPEVKVEFCESSNPSSPFTCPDSVPPMDLSSTVLPHQPQPTLKRETEEESDEEECEGSSEEDAKPSSKRKKNSLSKTNKRVKTEAANDEDFLKTQQEKHKISEKQRRLQTSEMLETMKNLLPGKKKLTKLQILEETLKYIHWLQEQNYKQSLELQLMRRAYYPPH